MVDARGASESRLSYIWEEPVYCLVSSFTVIGMWTGRVENWLGPQPEAVRRSTEPDFTDEDFGSLCALLLYALMLRNTSRSHR